MARSTAELMGLQYEAERMVRMGESRAEVARRLGLHQQTLAGWALKYGWRRKDLELERSAEATRRTILAIRASSISHRDQVEARARLTALMREGLGLLADGGDAAMEKLSLLIGQLQPPQAVAPPAIALSPDPRVAGFRSLGDARAEPGPRSDEG
jgi:transposase-like protein